LALLRYIQDEIREEGAAFLGNRDVNMNRMLVRSLAFLSLSGLLLSACAREAAPAPRLEPTRTPAPRATSAPATPAPAVTAATAATPAPQALTGLTLDNVDALAPAFSLRQSPPRNLYAVSEDRIAMFGTREFIVADPRTLQIQSRTPVSLSAQLAPSFWYAASANGRVGAIMQLDGAVDVYDLATSQVITRLLVPAPSSEIVSDIALNEDASEAIVISRGELRRINLKEGGLVGDGQSLPPASAFIRFSLDGSRVAAVQLTGEVVVVNTLSGAPPITITPELTAPIAALSLSPNGQKLGVSTEAGLMVWDLSGARPRVQQTFADLETPVETVFSRNGSSMALLAGPAAYLYDLDAQQGLGEFRLPGNVPVWSANFDPAGETFYLAGSGQMSAFRVPDGDPIGTAAQIPMTRASFSPDGRTVATWSTTFASGDAAVLSVVDGAPAGRLPHDAPLRWLIYSPSGRYIASLTLANTVHVWNTASGEPLADVAAPVTDTVRALLCFAADESRLYYLDGETVKAEPVAQNVPAGRIDLPFAPAALSTCINDKRLIAVADADTVEVIELDGTRVSRIELPADLGEIGALYLSRNGEKLGVIGRAMALVYDTATGAELQTIRLQREPLAGALSDDGRRLALNYGDDVDVIDTATGRALSLDLPKGSLVTVMFPRDSRLVVTAAQIASADTAGQPLERRNFVSGELTVWDVREAGRRLRTIEFDDPIFTASMSEDGRFIATNYASNGMTVWRIE
jgi:WD40 repeat protein